MFVHVLLSVYVRMRLCAYACVCVCAYACASTSLCICVFNLLVCLPACLYPCVVVGARAAAIVDEACVRAFTAAVSAEDFARRQDGAEVGRIRPVSARRGERQRQRARLSHVYGWRALQRRRPQEAVG